MDKILANRKSDLLPKISSTKKICPPKILSDKVIWKNFRPNLPIHFSGASSGNQNGDEGDGETC